METVKVESLQRHDNSAEREFYLMHYHVAQGYNVYYPIVTISQDGKRDYYLHDAIRATKTQ